VLGENNNNYNYTNKRVSFQPRNPPHNSNIERKHFYYFKITGTECAVHHRQYA
jgi:hypothetical protein